MGAIIMTKSERLIYIINLIRNHDGIQIDEIAELSEVSQRTAYRDISSLIQMRVPVRYDNGYRVVSTARMPPTELTPADFDLIRFAFRASDLFASKYFRERFRAIEEIIAGDLLPSQSKKRTRVHFTADDRSARTGKQDPGLAMFMEALFQGKTAWIRWKGGAKKGIAVTPTDVLVESDRIRMRAVNARTESLLEVDSRDLISVAVLG